MGVKAGLNRSGVSVGDRYSVLAKSYSDIDYQKEYSKKNKLAPQFSVMVTFLPIRKIGISFQPAFFSYKFSYGNEYTWMTEESSDPYYRLKFSFNNTLNYLELPLLAKYYLIDGNVLAFLQGGGFYGKLLNGNKRIKSTGIDNPGENEVISEQSKQSMDVNDLYIKTYMGWIAGGGVGFKADNFRIALEINYRRGLNNITNEKNRFSNNRLVNAYYDAPDDFSFTNWEASVSCSLPLDNLVHVTKKTDKSKSGRRF